jgi:hypothetical protein
MDFSPFRLLGGLASAVQSTIDDVDRAMAAAVGDDDAAATAAAAAAASPLSLIDISEPTRLM